MLLAAILLVGTFATEIADTDFWWHLKTGEYIVQHATLPVPDPFSYTSNLGPPAYPGEEQVRYFNLTHEWVSQAVWYLVYLGGGFAALVTGKGLLLAGLCGAAGWLAARRSGNLYVGLAAAFAPVPIARLFAADRPALVSFFMVALFVVMLERYQENGRAAWVWPLVPLQWMWANAHGGFFLGWVVLGAYAVGSLQWPGERRKPLWFAAGLAFLLSGLNPNGFRIFEILLNYGQSYLTSMLIEWKKPPLWGPPFTYNVLLYTSAAALVLRWRKVRLSDALLFLAFGTASLLAFRNVILIAFLGPVLLATYAWPVVASYLPRGPSRLMTPASALLLAAILVWQASHGGLFQLRVADWKFPRAAAEFLKENSVDVPLFNSYEYGGYLIWALGPQQKTFIDGRALNESVYRDYQKIVYSTGSSAAESQRQRNELLESYGARIVVMNSFEYVTGVIYPIVLALADQTNGEWVLVFEDAQAVIFARDVPENHTLIEKHRLDKGRVASHLMTCCETYIAHDPELPNCARTLGFLFLRAGDHARARAAFELYRKHLAFPDPEADQAYRQLATPGR